MRPGWLFLTSMPSGFSHGRKRIPAVAGPADDRFVENTVPLSKSKPVIPCDLRQKLIRRGWVRALLVDGAGEHLSDVHRRSGPGCGANPAADWRRSPSAPPASTFIAGPANLIELRSAVKPSLTPGYSSLAFAVFRYRLAVATSLTHLGP